jgi:sigma-B regulation protein RsbU (phosphoserine phosphatase)
MQRDEAWALIRRIYAAAGRRDATAIGEMYAEDAVAISPVFGEIRGRAAIARSWATLFSMFSDIALDIGDVLADGDRIAMLGRVRSTDRVGWFGLPPTGSPIDYRMAMLLTVAGGKIVRDERMYDSAGVVERLEKARVDKELQTAAVVQRALLSRTAHVNASSESIGDSLPCRAIGGDFFEFIDLPGGDVAIAMGDVAGKGPAAALLASMLQGMIAADGSIGDGAAATLGRVNRRLAARQLDARFVTLVYAVLSPDGRLTYSNAGHNAPAVVTRGGIRRLSAGGPILGAFPYLTFDEERLQLAANDTIVMFTDGVTEARNPAGEEFGEERLLASLSRAPDSTPGRVLRLVFEAVKEFCGQAEQSDDITVTVTRHGGRGDQMQ